MFVTCSCTPVPATPAQTWPLSQQVLHEFWLAPIGLVQLQQQSMQASTILERKKLEAAP